MPAAMPERRTASAKTVPATGATVVERRSWMANSEASSAALEECSDAPARMRRAGLTKRANLIHCTPASVFVVFPTCILLVDMNTRTPSRAPRTEQRIQGKKRSGNGVVRELKRELKRDVEIMERGFADHLKSMSEEVGSSDEEDTEDDEDDKDDGDDGDDKVDEEEEAAEENDKDDEEEEEKAEENDKDKEDHVHHPSGDENKDTLSRKRKRDDEDDGEVSSGEEIFEPPAVQIDSDSPVIGPPPATSVSTSASIAVSAPLTKSVLRLLA
ncbi:hypothetical protein VE01_01190 [Pseudogymnoascus verrucosus]|uniref:Uncharacterized protein n=1 Tax=Pseudogymnoascus verrucosus TaxID=342668 RepID=A0A1B8GY31_9PEZI|nr:uncharacterized protein VE01_01190 [Pseudogymnoascus verrucosus]OBU00745.1 hypothetical protein VE01_01190 [Pseudogymnoascus verrucosus]